MLFLYNQFRTFACTSSGVDAALIIQSPGELIKLINANYLAMLTAP